MKFYHMFCIKYRGGAEHALQSRCSKSGSNTSLHVDTTPRPLAETDSATIAPYDTYASRRGDAPRSYIHLRVQYDRLP
jgi:hypothetical protein